MVSELYQLYLNKTMTRRIKCHCIVYCTACYVQCTVQSTMYYTAYSSQCTVQCILLCSTTMAKLFKCVCLYFLWRGYIFCMFIKQKTSINKTVFIFMLNFIGIFSYKFKYLYTTHLEIRTLCHLLGMVYMPLELFFICSGHLYPSDTKPSPIKGWKDVFSHFCKQMCMELHQKHKYETATNKPKPGNKQLWFLSVFTPWYLVSCPIIHPYPMDPSLHWAYMKDHLTSCFYETEHLPHLICDCLNCFI